MLMRLIRQLIKKLRLGKFKEGAGDRRRVYNLLVLKLKNKLSRKNRLVMKLKT